MATRRAQQTILLFHGDIFMRHAVAEYLRKCGLRVVEAASTDEAVAVLERLDIDGVIGDATAPGTRSRSEVVALAENRKPRPRIIEITGSRERVASAAADLCRSNGGRVGPLPLQH